MSDPVDVTCPAWCDQPAGHLHVETAGPGDYHVSAFSLVDLPEIPGIREVTAIQVAIEQYVTSATAHDPLISLGIGNDDPDSEPLTLDEAEALATTLRHAVTRARDAQTHRSPNGESPA